MGKTHEALLRAEKEYQAKIPQIGSASQKALALVPSKAVITTVSAKWYQELRARILTLYPDGSIKTIMFTGTSPRSGTTRTAADFAAFLANEYQHKVLLVDANLRTPGLHNYFGQVTDFGLEGLLPYGQQLDTDQKNKVNNNLFVITCNRDKAESINLFETKRFKEFITTMRESFDYVVFDVPPITQFIEARIISPQIDGVILIIESGKTRRQVALKAKNELGAAGGNFMGVVLNRRKFYIPKWIYKRL